MQRQIKLKAQQVEKYSTRFDIEKDQREAELEDITTKLDEVKYAVEISLLIVFS